MSSKTQKLVMGAVVVLVLAAVGYGVWSWRPANTANYPEGTHWICQNAACKNEFTMSVQAYSDFQQKHYGEKLPCPKCGKTQTVAAWQCQQCKKFVARERGNTVCPHCKTPRAAA